MTDRRSAGSVRFPDTVYVVWSENFQNLIILFESVRPPNPTLASNEAWRAILGPFDGSMKQ